MRILFLLVDEPFYTPTCVSSLLDRWHGYVVGAAFPSGFFEWKRVRTTLALYGPVGVAVRSIRMAIAGAAGGVVHRQFRSRGIPCIDIDDVNGSSFLHQVRQMQADLIVSFNCPQKIKPALLALPARGCINVHFGMLPRYRGILPIFYALLNGDSSFGVTVHFMDAKLDNGDIVTQTAVPIEPGDDLESLYPRGFAAATELLHEAFDSFERGDVPRRPNPEADKTYFSYPTPEMIRRYRHLVRSRR